MLDPSVPLHIPRDSISHHSETGLTPQKKAEGPADINDDKCGAQELSSI